MTLTLTFPDKKTASIGTGVMTYNCGVIEITLGYFSQPQTEDTYYTMLHYMKNAHVLEGHRHYILSFDTQAHNVLQWNSFLKCAKNCAGVKVQKLFESPGMHQKTSLVYYYRITIDDNFALPKKAKLLKCTAEGT